MWCVYVMCVSVFAHLCLCASDSRTQADASLAVTFQLRVFIFAVGVGVAMFWSPGTRARLNLIKQTEGTMRRELVCQYS